MWHPFKSLFKETYIPPKPINISSRNLALEMYEEAKFARENSKERSVKKVKNTLILYCI